MAVDLKSLRPYQKQDADSSPSLEGTWQNELGSTMSITSFDGTSFSGTYTSAVSEGGSSVSGTLSGTVAGGTIAFTVNWELTYGSVTAWSGLLLSAGQNLVIYALWHLASTPESESNFWQSINAGADLFFRA